MTHSRHQHHLLHDTATQRYSHTPTRRPLIDVDTYIADPSSAETILGPAVLHDPALPRVFNDLVQVCWTLPTLSLSITVYRVHRIEDRQIYIGKHCIQDTGEEGYFTALISQFGGYHSAFELCRVKAYKSRPSNRWHGFIKRRVFRRPSMP